jgi:FkbH-like protein
LTNENQNSSFRIAVAASFTAEPLAPAVSFWAGQLDARFDVRFAPYNQAVQTLLDPASEFGSNPHGVNVLLVRLRDLAQDEARLEESAAYLIEVLRTAVGRLLCPVIFCSDDKELLAPASRIPGLHVLAHSEIARLYPVSRKLDPEADRLGKIPYTGEWFVALATALVRRIAALSLAPYKAIAVDCDNTLWDGICGEDGPGGVVLDAPRRALHRFLISQRDAGMVLCIASKNNPEDVAETFRDHPEFPLQPGHFTASRVNWESKAANLESMADELGLGLDSFILIDDSPKECAEVDEAAPEVLALTLPADTGAIPHFLEHVWAFDRPVVTAEDRVRAASYAQAREFGRAFHNAHSLEDFMATLDLRVTIEPVTSARIARVAQLTQRTNQFNFTGERRSEAEVAASHEWCTVAVSDRFGDYGLVGAMLLAEAGSEMRVESFLLSCRVLGRGVEHRMLAHVGELAVRRALPSVAVRFRDTGKNQPALQFLKSIGPAPFAAEYLKKLKWTPTAPALAAAKKLPARPTEHRFVPFERIARELSTVAQIMKAMRPAEAEAGGSDIAASMTETERELARIWRDLLNLRSVNPDDRFFDLGGHSLLAVLLISRVREAFGVELAIDDVYSGSLTLRELGTKVESGRLSGLAPDEYEAMLAEIEGLSDEEVRALLDS